MQSPPSPFSAHAVHRRRHAGTATGCPTRRAPDQTRCRAPGLARNRSPWHPPALATRPATLCSPRRRGWPATRRSTRAPRPRPTQHLLSLLASPSHSPPLPRHGNPVPAPSCSRTSSPPPAIVAAAPCSSGATTSGIPPPKPSPGIAPWPLTGPPKPTDHRPKPPASCSRGTPWPPSPCSRGAPTSGLPSPKLSPGIAPLPPPEAPRPLLALSPSPERRSRDTGPPPAAGARGQAAAGRRRPPQPQLRPPAGAHEPPHPFPQLPPRRRGRT